MRPTTRPEKPYTREEIAQRVRQHFIVEGNPVCADDTGRCFYTQTGCGIGCLMTMDDATAIGNGFYFEGVRATPGIMRAYFRPEDDEFLSDLQHTHDRCSYAFDREEAIKQSLEDFLKENNL